MFSDLPIPQSPSPPVPQSPSLVIDRINTIRGKLPTTVKLIAITKQVSLSGMRAAYSAGIRDFGESRIQEAEAKQAQLQDLTNITWHLIGHLQTNKVAKALELFEWIHSVDSLKLAERLDQLAGQNSQRPKVCLQVKIMPDPNKYGWAVDNLKNDLESLDRLQNLNIVGLMTIPPLGLTEIETISVYQQTKDLAETIKQQNWPNLSMEHLSMGMSEDYHLAVDAGATMIRLGRILFGERI